MNQTVKILRWWPYNNLFHPEKYEVSYIIGVYTNVVQLELAKCHIQETFKENRLIDISENAFDVDEIQLNNIIPEEVVEEFKEDNKGEN